MPSRKVKRTELSSGFNGSADLARHFPALGILPQAVDAAFVRQPGPLLGDVENLLARRRRHRLVLVAPKEEPLFGTEHTVVVAQLGQEPWRKQRVAVFALMESFP
jgi:hypothetical protein